MIAIVQRAREAGVEFVRARARGRPDPTKRSRRGTEWPASGQGAVELEAKVTIAADGRNSSLVRQTGQTRQLDRLRPRLVGLKRHMTIDDPDLLDARDGRSPRRTRWLRVACVESRVG